MIAPGFAVRQLPTGRVAPFVRRFKRPRLTCYHRLTLSVLVVNLGVFLYHQERGDWLISDGTALSALSTVMLVNVAVAILIRQQHVINFLFRLAGRGARSWPLGLRSAVSKVYHVGGIHVGETVAGTVWLVAFTCAAIVARSREAPGVSPATLVLAGSLVAVTVLIAACAVPPVRRRAHNAFEVTHRFGGWTALALF